MLTALSYVRLEVIYEAEEMCDFTGRAGLGLLLKNLPRPGAGERGWMVGRLLLLGASLLLPLFFQRYSHDNAHRDWFDDTGLVVITYLGHTSFKSAVLDLKMVAFLVWKGT